MNTATSTVSGKLIFNMDKRSSRISRLLLTVDKVFLKFAAAAANKIKFVFPGDMCVGENTSQPANVEMAAAWADIEAMQRAVSISPAKSLDFAGDLSSRISRLLLTF